MNMDITIGGWVEQAWETLEMVDIGLGDGSTVTTDQMEKPSSLFFFFVCFFGPFDLHN